MTEDANYTQPRSTSSRRNLLLLSIVCLLLAALAFSAIYEIVTLRKQLEGSNLKGAESPTSTPSPTQSEFRVYLTDKHFSRYDYNDKLIAAYLISIPRGEEWIDTKINLQPGNILYFNFDYGEGYLSSEKVRESSGQFEIKVGPFIQRYNYPLDNSNFFIIHLVPEKENGGIGQIVLQSNEHLLVRSLDKNIHIKLDLYSRKEKRSHEKAKAQPRYFGKE